LYCELYVPAHQIKKRYFLSPWFDTECYEAKLEKNRKLRIFRSSNTGDFSATLRNYQDANKAYREICKKKRLLSEEAKQQKLMNHENSNEFWKAVNSIRNTRFVPSSIPVSQWESHFEGVFSSEPPPEAIEEVQELQIPEAQFLIDKISSQEIINVSESLKLGKAPGVDCLPNDYWKALTNSSLEVTQLLFNKILEIGKIPHTWCQAVISPIYKKRDKTKPINYRPISILPTILKFFTIILNVRLNRYVDPDPPAQKILTDF